MAKKSKKHMSKKALRRRRRRRLLVAEFIILFMLIGVLYVYNKLGMIDYVNIDSVKINELNDETEEVLKGYVTIALFGVDNRTMGNYESGNSDTLIVMSINIDTKEIRMMSVYRDSYLNVYSDTYNKCNSAYAQGGPEAAMQMLNKNLDLDISEFVSVDFKALADAVDAVGGLELDVTNREAREMNKFISENSRWVGKKSSQISGGTQVLDGVQTLAYARIRHDSSDFRRAQRQRTVVSKLIEKAKKASLPQLNSLVDAIFPEVSTSFSISEILSMAKDVKEYHLGETGGFPKDLSTKNMGKKGDCVIPCTLLSNVTYVHQFLFDELDYVPTNTVSNISNKIISDTGYTEQSAVDFGFSIPDGAEAEPAEGTEAQ